MALAPPMILPHPESKRIAAACRYAILKTESDYGGRLGPVKYKYAEGLALSALKSPRKRTDNEDASGIPAGIGGGMPPALQTMIDSLGDVSGDVVDVVAGAAEQGEGCVCDDKALAFLKMLLKASIETGLSFLP